MNRREFFTLTAAGLAMSAAGLWSWLQRGRNPAPLPAEELLLRLLGIEELPGSNRLDLYHRCLEAGGEGFQLACTNVLAYGRERSQSAGTGRADWDAFLADVSANNDLLPPKIGFALEIVWTHAVTAFYRSAEGRQLCGYGEPPVRNTRPHNLLRQWFFPNCNQACHWVKRTLLGPPNPFGW